MKKTTLSALALVAAFSSVLTPAGNAYAQYYDGSPPRWDRRGPPPPPRHDRDHDRDRRHHHNNGSAIAGGLAAGVIGGLIGGAIVNSGPRYVEPPPPPPPRCWFEDQRVRNAYNGGSHIESVRVCD